MKKNLKKELVEKYRTTVKENTKAIKKIFLGLDIAPGDYLPEYKKILDSSSRYVSARWEKGEKYTRTEFVINALGEKYPHDLLKLSLSVDAMINILDDLLDENLEPKTKMLFVIEYLRVFAVYNTLADGFDINSRMALYFNKLIMLAVFENGILEKFKSTNNKKSMNKMAVDLLLSRGQDIDIFVEIGTADLKLDSKEAEAVSRVARNFRAINIFKKDILDIEHDRENGQETLVTASLDRGKLFFKQFVTSVVASFESEMQDLVSSSGGNGTPVQSFYGMLKREQAYIVNDLL